ncbi:hypothetical protein [Kitasatospora aureofaciens]|uniref:hypothetical protein n=1 Tax=Kitasatospora aureofaciens TaxID=1894 RepID=UPI001C446CB1|nr:hypothetical protein [Kitasatospora aureofaciens]MBV6696785.1 hypothetical protein [Kitasatospora aureofaciens]
MTSIELHIDHLVLDGVDGDPGEIADALRSELARLLASAPAADWRPGRAHLRRGPEVSVGPAATTGRDLAASVYRAVRDGH